MTAESNASAVAQHVWDAWNAHDPDRYASLLAEDFLIESDTVPAPVRGREQARNFMEMYIRAFPDLQFTIDQTLVAGDFVVSRYTARGTQRGELAGTPPTNRRVVTHGCTVTEVKEGKPTRSWLYWDRAHLLQQLGVTPAGGSAKPGASRASAKQPTTKKGRGSDAGRTTGKGVGSYTAGTYKTKGKRTKRGGR